jgi:hypothetical protein
LLDEPHAKWRFDGPHLKTHLPDEERPQCLSFRSQKERIPSDYLEVVVGHCKGYKSQRWFIKIHEGQLGEVVNSKPRLYFSIHSEVLPDKCLTKHRWTVDCNLSHKFHRTWTDDIVQLCPEPFEGLFLADCNGCDEQSFFIDASFLDIVKNIGATGQVNSYDAFRALAPSKLPACQYTDSFDTDHKSKCKLANNILKILEFCYRHDIIDHTRTRSIYQVNYSQFLKWMEI